ncbi:major facilitator superfamily domain-containing protein [Aspergillus undulatus]|uniref:major facilitator superfamily domain-containing protein n=1 Tax=Aspergillus undulatus TaxID=1810928 RepID=UPI003CCDA5B9
MKDSKLCAPPIPCDPEQGSITDIALDGVPGTRLLIDHTDTEVVLLPRPTSSPDDPLNWGWKRKYIAQSIVFIWAFMLGAATLSPAVTYAGVISELDASTEYLNTGAAYAWTGKPVVQSPLRFGRRYLYFSSALSGAASQVVTTTAHNKAAFVGGRILLGFGAAPFEQLPALTVNDQFYVHQRGLGLSIYTLAITTGSFLGPVAAGFVVDSMGWRWVYWFYAIFLLAIAVLIFLGLEETEIETHDAHPLPTPIWRIAINPFLLLAGLIIWWCSIMYGFGVAWLTIMAYESTTIFTLYGFSSSSLGLTNIAPLIVSCLVVWLGGPGTGKFMVWKARRNNGVMEPETRIYSVFFAGPITGAGLILYGVGATRSVHWAGPIIGMGMIGSALPIAAEVALGYVSESYPSLAGEATTAVILIRNAIGCGMTFAISPWIESSGLQNAFVAVGLLAFGVFVSGGLLIWKGKACRRLEAKRYYAMVALQSDTAL